MSSQNVDRTALRSAIAAELRAARARAGISQDALADLTGLSRATVNRLETGERAVGLEVLYLFADALEFDAGELVDAAKRQYLQQIARGDVERD